MEQKGGMRGCGNSMQKIPQVLVSLPIAHECLEEGLLDIFKKGGGLGRSCLSASVVFL